jgi:choline transport protein
MWNSPPPKAVATTTDRLLADIPNSFSEIRPGLNVPACSILACFVFNVCFGLLYLGLSVAFYAYVASCTIFLNISYALPVVVVLVRGRKFLQKLQKPDTAFKLGRYGTALN